MSNTIITKTDLENEVVVKIPGVWPGIKTWAMSNLLVNLIKKRKYMKAILLLLIASTLFACNKQSVDLEDKEPIMATNRGKDPGGVIINPPIPGYGHGYFTVSFDQDASDHMVSLLTQYNFPKELNFMANGIVVGRRVVDQYENDPSCTNPGWAVIVDALFTGEQHQPVTYLNVIDENNDTLWSWEGVAKRDYCIKVLFRKDDIYK